MTIDTIGGTSGGSASSYGFAFAYQVTASASGLLQSIGVNMASGTGNMEAAIYSDNGSDAPLSLLASSSSVAAAMGWNDVPITGVSIVSGIKYWIAFQVSSSALNAYYSFTPLSTQASYAQAYGAFPPGASYSTSTNASINMRMAYIALVIDGSGSNLGTKASPPTVTLSTTNPNDIIIIYVAFNGVSGETIIVSDTSSLTWTLRSSETADASTATSHMFYAVSTGILTGDVIHVSATGASGTANALGLIVFGISGANTTTPFDVNASLPATFNNQGSISSASSVISTTNASDIVFGFISLTPPLTETFTYVPSGTALITQISGPSMYITSFYEIVSSVQSSISYGASWTNAAAVSMIVDAIQAGSIVFPTVPTGEAGIQASLTASVTQVYMLPFFFKKQTVVG
jgi:hypothetical protein